MPKKVLQVTNFSGGLNAYADARDIKDSEFVQAWDAVVDRDGIVRVSGMATDSIYADVLNNLDNYNSAGYGLFQFSVDYAYNGMDGSFTRGFKTGSISGYNESGSGAGGENLTLEAGVDAQALHFWKDYIIYIKEGSGAGQSRIITASSTASPPVLSFTTDMEPDPATDGTSKYSIFRWFPSSDWKSDGTNNYDFIKIIEDLEKEVAILKANSHPVSDFVCTTCGSKAKRVKDNINEIEEKF